MLICKRLLYSGQSSVKILLGVCMYVDGINIPGVGLRGLLRRAVVLRMHLVGGIRVPNGIATVCVQGTKRDRGKSAPPI